MNQLFCYYFYSMRLTHYLILFKILCKMTNHDVEVMI